MRDTYKDDDTLIEIQRACGWHATVALLEIVNDPGCMRRLEDLALSRALLELEDPAPQQAASAIQVARGERLVVAATVLVILLLLPGSVGGLAGILSAVGVAAAATALAPRIQKEAVLGA